MRTTCICRPVLSSSGDSLKIPRKTHSRTTLKTPGDQAVVTWKKLISKATGRALNSNHLKVIKKNLRARMNPYSLAKGLETALSTIAA